IAAQAGDGPGMAGASATKVFGTEFATEAYRLLMEVLGANALVRDGSAGAILAGRIERMHRSSLILTFGGGTNEVQRDLIAAAALALPIGRRRGLATHGFQSERGRARPRGPDPQDPHRPADAGADARRRGRRRVRPGPVG